jgi:preprotein translocase subunit SecE
MWGFESLLPCQISRGARSGINGSRGFARVTGREKELAEALLLKNEGETGGSGRSNNIPGPVQRAWQTMLEYPRRAQRFLHLVRVEIRQVTWPSYADVRSTTAVVIATVFFFGVFLTLVDIGFSSLVQQVLKFFKR